MSDPFTCLSRGASRRVAFAASLATLGAAHCSHHRSSQVAKATADLALEAIAERSKPDRPPPSQLDRGALPHCGVFSRYLDDCPTVPLCSEALVTHARLELNVCVNEQSSLSRIGGCRVRGRDEEQRCALRTFPSCSAVKDAPCAHDLVVCEAGALELAVAQCCNDAARGCVLGTYRMLPTKPTSPR